MEISIAPIVLTAMILLMFGVGWWMRGDQIAARDREIAFFKQWYRTRSGWSEGFGSYHLKSVDGGKTWVSFDSKTSTMTGLANPALVAHLDGWNALTEYVKTYGPIGSHPITKDDIKALERAGFTVRETIPPDAAP
jgi:hypothetical protein